MQIKNLSVVFALFKHPFALYAEADKEQDCVHNYLYNALVREGGKAGGHNRVQALYTQRGDNCLNNAQREVPYRDKLVLVFVAENGVLVYVEIVDCGYHPCQCSGKVYVVRRGQIAGNCHKDCEHQYVQQTAG